MFLIASISISWLRLRYKYWSILSSFLALERLLIPEGSDRFLSLDCLFPFWFKTIPVLLLYLLHWLHGDASWLTKPDYFTLFLIVWSIFGNWTDLYKLSLERLPFLILEDCNLSLMLISLCLSSRFLLLLAIVSCTLAYFFICFETSNFTRQIGIYLSTKGVCIYESCITAD